MAPRKGKLTREERDSIRFKKYEARRIIKQAYCHVDRFHGGYWHPGDGLLEQFARELDGARGPILAACSERHVQKLEERGLSCTWQVDRPVPTEDVLLGKIYRRPNAQGSLHRFKFSAPFKGAFVGERLQKQLNLNGYLVALRNAVEVDAPMALLVPNAHYELVDDHLNLFTAGTLAYNLVRAGWDCSSAIFNYDRRFINVLLRRRDVPEPGPLRVDELAPYLPFKNVFQYCTGEFVEVYRNMDPIS